MDDKLLDLDSLYSVRMLIFIETSPQSNKYQQVMLTDTQYGSVSRAVHDQFQKDPNHKCMNPECDGIALLISDKVIPLPDLKETHSCVGLCKC